ncbi:ABC transporter permease [Paenibacillus sp. ACRRX]|uniref:FtsX-like permease family protein n=1 Tax=unclassified Paenibacillus TaxID=185978 RepID=UPI001EF73B38|nr:MULTISPECIES: ABC transporter permease [unclassified Paenibacillus]MCG7409622.1 ABC transporter permease [Paenibacillus sp. ACRRX]MDK8183302.1 ABC transporter permease [Paenibacillus sp. UMB4589-SE434]
MTFRQFAFNNVIRNKRIYLAHFLSSSFSVMVFFVYALLLFHPNLQGELASTSDTMSHLATMGMNISQYLIFIFSFFFCLYSVSAFLKTRKREFGILMVHGLSHKQLHRLVFTENMIIGGAAVTAGILTGLIFAKLVLLMSAKVLYIDKGLPFYFPVQAIWITIAAFAVLFLVVSFFTSRLVKVGHLVELLKSEEKPKPEPKASVWLSLLAVVLILAGYSAVFYFVIERVYSLLLLASGVVLVVAGTYFLFTQLSVYVIHSLRKKEPVFLSKTNMVTISELAYRMKDNATMFFMISIISAVAFTGIGTCIAIADPGLEEMENPYAFTYVSNLPNKLEKEHVELIKRELTASGFSYKLGTAVPLFTDSGVSVINLSDYNSLAVALGHPTESLSNDNEAILLPSIVSEKTSYERGEYPDEVMIMQHNVEKAIKIQKAVPYLVLPYYGETIVITDAKYKTLMDEAATKKVEQSKRYLFAVPGWQKSKELSNQLAQTIGNDYDNGNYYFSALVLNWISSKQENGILFIVSTLVGVVFFTFAASFLYFRLYTDLERDRQQYQMIGKLGLTRKELHQIVSRQLVLMFFLPIVMALIHSGVAFIALQQLVDYSVLKGSIMIFVSFVSIQIVYFMVIRWRYLQHLRQKAV